MDIEIKNRMNGLVNIPDLAALKTLKYKMRADLIKEGFDADDAADYVDGTW